MTKECGQHVRAASAGAVGAAGLYGIAARLAQARAQAVEQRKLELVALGQGCGYASARVRSYMRRGGGWRATLVGYPPDGAGTRPRVLAVVEMARTDELAALHALVYAVQLGGNPRA